MRVLLCLLGSPDRPLVASDLPPLVSAAVNENLHRRCRRSKFVAELGYELELCANPYLRFLAHCFAMILATIEIILSRENVP